MHSQMPSIRRGGPNGKQIRKIKAAPQTARGDANVAAPDGAPVGATRSVTLAEMYP